MPGRPIRALVAVLLGALILFSLEVRPVGGENLGPSWNSSTGYPTAIGLESCVTNGDYSYVYCIGGLSNSAYSSAVEYAPFFSSGGGVGGWASTTAYPASLDGEACVSYIVFIYCIGGYSGGSYTNGVYFTQTSSNGVGTWSSTNPYPGSIGLLSCVVNAGFVYCLGGYDGSRYNSAAYYAQLSPAGGMKSSWTATTAYPEGVSGQSCVVYSGYIYCVGGETVSTSTSDVYFAPLLTPGGIGNWTKTTSYPTTIYSQSCAVASGYVYCVGGYGGTSYTSSVYYAPVSQTGVGAWSPATPYPMKILDQSCVMFSGYLYCIGGNYNFNMINSVYYDPVAPVLTPTVTSTTTVTYTATSGVSSTSTVSTTVLVTVTQTTVTSVITTSVSLVTITRTSFASTTYSNTTTTTLTATSRLTSTLTTTVSGVTVTSIAGVTQPSSTPISLEAELVAAGLVLGAVLAVAGPRARKLRRPKVDRPSAEEEGSDDEGDSEAGKVAHASGGRRVAKFATITLVFVIVVWIAVNGALLMTGLAGISIPPGQSQGSTVSLTLEIPNHSYIPIQGRVVTFVYDASTGNVIGSGNDSFALQPGTTSPITISVQMTGQTHNDVRVTMDYYVGAYGVNLPFPIRGADVTESPPSG